MSDGVQKLVDASGDVCYAVRDGQPVADPAWQSARLVLTSDSLVVATNDDKQTVPHKNSRLADADVVPDSLDAEGAIPLRVGDVIVLLDASSIDDLAAEYRRAVLHDEVILVKHPAVVGDVVQDEATWSKARFRFDDDRIDLGLPEGETAAVPIDDVGSIETSSAQVSGRDRRVVAVEHTDEGGRAVETRFTGTDRHVTALADLLGGVLASRDEDVELSEAETQVLMALYSGVSPFEMADFVGLDVDEVEEIYGNLLAVGAVDEVRERTEVSLNATGRNLASEAMNEQ